SDLSPRSLAWLLEHFIEGDIGGTLSKIGNLRKRGLGLRSRRCSQERDRGGCRSSKRYDRATDTCKAGFQHGKKYKPSCQVSHSYLIARRQNSRTISRRSNGVLPVCSPRTIFRVDGPLIISINEVIFSAKSNQRLNRQNGTFLNQRAAVGFAFIGQERIFMHGAANAVAPEPINNEKLHVPLIFSFISRLFNSVGNIRQAIAGLHSSDALF